MVSRFALCILKRNNWIVHKARGIQRFFKCCFKMTESYCFSSPFNLPTRHNLTTEPANKLPYSHIDGSNVPIDVEYHEEESTEAEPTDEVEDSEWVPEEDEEEDRKSVV